MFPADIGPNKKSLQMSKARIMEEAQRLQDSRDNARARPRAADAVQGESTVLRHAAQQKRESLKNKAQQALRRQREERAKTQALDCTA